MKKLSLILMPLSLVVLGSCGEKKSESYTYDLTENSCETGSHSFSSKEGYCDALKNEELNHHCAASLRQETYESQSCPGSFFN